MNVERSEVGVMKAWGSDGWSVECREVMGNGKGAEGT